MLINIFIVIINKCKAVINNIKIKKAKLGKLGSNVDISRCFYFIKPENIFIDENVYIGSMSTIYAHAHVLIKKGSIIGPKVTIYTANHNFKTGAHAIPYDKQLNCRAVEIGENVWIGGNVILLPGTKLGEGVIVGAGSVVAKEIKPYSIVVGNPCKIIGTRNIDEYRRLKSENAIYLKNKEL
jgi:acetyltransferase-like isoleucine patch superfamily enzyme